MKFINDFNAITGFNMQDVKLHGKGIRNDFRNKIIEIFFTEKQDRLIGKNEITFGYEQVENWTKSSIRKTLDKMRMLR